MSTTVAYTPDPMGPFEVLPDTGGSSGSGSSGSGSSSPEVFHVAGSGTPSTVPANGAGFGYNDVGNTFTYQSTGWAQIT